MAVATSAKLNAVKVLASHVACAKPMVVARGVPSQNAPNLVKAKQVCVAHMAAANDVATKAARSMPNIKGGAARTKVSTPDFDSRVGVSVFSVNIVYCIHMLGVKCDHASIFFVAFDFYTNQAMHEYM